MPKIDRLLDIVKSANASDLHLVSGSVPIIRVDGRLEKTRHRHLSDDEIRQLLYEILTDDQIREFEKSGDIDLAYGIEGMARFRVNVYNTYTGAAAAIRIITARPLGLDALGFSPAVAELAENKSGLILVTGPTNSGKTTTLAALVDHINTQYSKHIITLEDPIEYVHTSRNSLISQRQVGLHSETFASGLRAALREDPDVVLVGEMRDIETIGLAVTAAEVGLLVMGTLHTNSASSTVDRIIEVFPVDQQQQIRVMLADSLGGIVSQQLLHRSDGVGRVVAYEMMVRTTSIASMIRERKNFQIPTAIQTGGKQGMQLLDSHLKKLVEEGTVTAEEAMKFSADPSKFQQMTTKARPEMAGIRE